MLPSTAQQHSAFQPQQHPPLAFDRRLARIRAVSSAAVHMRPLERVGAARVGAAGGCGQQRLRGAALGGARGAAQHLHLAAAVVVGSGGAAQRRGVSTAAVHGRPCSDGPEPHACWLHEPALARSQCGKTRHVMCCCLYANTHRASCVLAAYSAQALLLAAAAPTIASNSPLLQTSRACSGWSCAANTCRRQQHPQQRRQWPLPLWHRSLPGCLVGCCQARCWQPARSCQHRTRSLPPPP
jgi:hypothetical protein